MELIRFPDRGEETIMCGIAGMVRLDGASVGTEDRAAVACMTEAQKHRGPDGEGLYASGAVVFGHRRLAIIDLSDEGLQPMTNESRNLWVLFNGEIYNYRDLRAELLARGHMFRGMSDSEVLLHGYEEWGITGLLRNLRGMFAFTLYDETAYTRRNGSPYFFAARDRLGIKPLYFTIKDGRSLAFASEARALLRAGIVSRDVDREALAAFLSLGSISSPQTWLQDVECLPPGHYLEAGMGGWKQSQYWQISYVGEPAENLAATLDDAVRRHLIADVPVGVFLSGGVDSGGIAALAARERTAPVSTLTIVFDEEEFTEAAEARAFAEAFGTQHHEIRVTAQDFAAETTKLLEAVDQPTADGVNTYFVSRAARQLGLKVVLSGLGGDEVFFGYPHYRALAGKSGALGAFTHSGALTRTAVRFGASLYGRVRGIDTWQRFGYCSNRSLAEGLYLLVRGFFPPTRVCRLLGMSASGLDAALDRSFASTRVAGENGHFDPNRFHYIEMRKYLHDQLLRDSDVFSMAHSIELRVPLLDDKVVEAGCRIPPASKISSRINKPNLVDAIDHPRIREAAARPKRGFTFPFSRWLLQNANEFEERAARGTLLDRDEVRNCWTDFRSGRLHWSRAWATVVLGGFNR